MSQNQETAMGQALRDAKFESSTERLAKILQDAYAKKFAGDASSKACVDYVVRRLTDQPKLWSVLFENDARGCGWLFSRVKACAPKSDGPHMPNSLAAWQTRGVVGGGQRRSDLPNRGAPAAPTTIQTRPGAAVGGRPPIETPVVIAADPNSPVAGKSGSSVGATQRPLPNGVTPPAALRPLEPYEIERENRRREQARRAAELANVSVVGPDDNEVVGFRKFTQPKSGHGKVGAGYIAMASKLDDFRVDGILIADITIAACRELGSRHVVVARALNKLALRGSDNQSVREAWADRLDEANKIIGEAENVAA